MRKIFVLFALLVSCRAAETTKADTLFTMKEEIHALNTSIKKTAAVIPQQEEALDTLNAMLRSTSHYFTGRVLRRSIFNLEKSISDNKNKITLQESEVRKKQNAFMGMTSKEEMVLLMDSIDLLPPHGTQPDSLIIE